VPEELSAAELSVPGVAAALEVLEAWQPPEQPVWPRVFEETPLVEEAVWRQMEPRVCQPVWPEQRASCSAQPGRSET
jgi:hypothetical protein